MQERMPWSDEQHSLNRRRNDDMERRTNIEKPSRQSAFNRLGRSFHTNRNTEDYTTQIHEVEEPDRSVFCRLGKKFSSNSNMEDYTTQRHEVEEPDRRSVFCRLGKFTSSNSNTNKKPYSSRTGPLQTPRQRYDSLSIAEKVVLKQRRQSHLAHQEYKSNKCFSKQDDIYDDEVEYVGYGPSSSNRPRPSYKRRRESSSSNMERSKKSKVDEHFKSSRPVTPFRNPSRFKELLKRKKFATRSIEYTAPNLSEYFSGKSWKDFVEEIQSEFEVLMTQKQEESNNPAKQPNVSTEVCRGNIVDESTDAIFNGVSANFDLHWGKVSPALLSKAGNQLQHDCATNPLVNTTYIRATKGYNLPCKFVLHIVTPNSLKDMTERIKSALNQAQNLGATSISIPTLGAGGVGLNPTDVAKAMNEAISQFKSEQLSKYLKLKILAPSNDSSKAHDAFADTAAASKVVIPNNVTAVPANTVDVTINNVASLNAAAQCRTPTLINKIRIVVFDPLLLPTFQKEIYSHDGEKEQNELGSIAQKWNVLITGSAGGQLNQAYTCVFQERLNVFHDCEISDSVLSELEENEKAEINKLAKKCGVTCKIYETESPKIIVSGLRENVNSMEEEVKNLLRELVEASIVAKISVWKWEKVPGGEITCLPLRASRAMSINYERFQKSQESTCSVNVCCEKVLMDFSSMTFKCGNNTGKIFLSETHSASQTPQDWVPMLNEGKGKYVIPCNSQEYQRIVKRFKESNPTFSLIDKIERIQDTSLYNQYQIRKKDVAKHILDSSQPVERELFHGTSSDDAHKIIASGFDRGFAGKNATAYGKGTYFAVSSSYSASSTYCRADYSGLKYMFLALVLTGNFCQGSSSYIAAPALNSTTGRLYDSVVDNVSSPSMFVVFKDTSVYPKYLITFR